MALPFPIAPALPGGFPGAGRESPRTGESLFQCHKGAAIPGLAGTGLSTPQKRLSVTGGGIFCIFLCQTPDEYTVRGRFLAQLLTTWIDLFAVNPALASDSS